jgi:putative AdoMet-dependent methyltransferase
MVYQDENSQEELRADFDEWAETYDRDVRTTVDKFPFAGYDRALSKVWQKAQAGPGMSILDLGVGTGNLARFFVESGCQVVGVDFSTEMLAKTREKLPQLELFQADLTLEKWPLALDRRFDCIVSNYTFHEFSLERKLRILTRLAADHLEPNGHIIIGDIMFPNQAALNKTKEDCDEVWEDEFYWLADETRSLFEPLGWEIASYPVSFCAGVFVFRVPAAG